VRCIVDLMKSIRSSRDRSGLQVVCVVLRTLTNPTWNEVDCCAQARICARGARKIRVRICNPITSVPSLSPSDDPVHNVSTHAHVFNNKQIFVIPSCTDTCTCNSRGVSQDISRLIRCSRSEGIKCFSLRGWWCDIPRQQISCTLLHCDHARLVF
jgi:hypothetical protein